MVTLNRSSHIVIQYGSESVHFTAELDQMPNVEWMALFTSLAGKEGRELELRPGSINAAPPTVSGTFPYDGTGEQFTAMLDRIGELAATTDEQISNRHRFIETLQSAADAWSEQEG